MTKRMLIDSTHAEETRVVVLDGTRLEDFDVETSAKRHLKGNIYLAKVVRVEPSLQAAFVEYGGNRHGFLAFSEIHPDYYQIPVADRQRLLAMDAEDARRDEEEEALNQTLRRVEAQQAPRRDHGRRERRAAEPAPDVAVAAPQGAPDWARAGTPALVGASRGNAPERDADAPVAAIHGAMWSNPDRPALFAAPPAAVPVERPAASGAVATRDIAWALAAEPAVLAPVSDTDASDIDPVDINPSDIDRDIGPSASYDSDGDDTDPVDDGDMPPPETLGDDSDSGDEREVPRHVSRFMRNYKIQEVIRRRQIILVQVVKEERGTKGAALTTYLSLAGRFSVLMPNSPRGGGISRKITSPADRRRLKEVTAELAMPRGMGLIIRTAGAARPKPEIKRDCEYLLRLWDDIREHTLRSIAPSLIYEEASLIKRAIRDVYSRDVEEILVDGTDGWRSAHDFMAMLMPSHARKVQLWSERGQPLFSHYQVEAQLDAMLQPLVQLRSGGYLVINQAEALVAIDVNSGRSTRERNIEETALRTNLEAADEVARQLRLRDLAGLIVIDFIDMESRRHNAMVEKRLKDALRNDRARIQIGGISHFGLLEMSRQRLRPSLTETTFVTCPHCGGSGHVRTTESAAIHVLRGIEDEASKRRSPELIIHVATPIALYVLNQKRERLQEIERRYAVRILVMADDSLIQPRFRVERPRTPILADAPHRITPDTAPFPVAAVEPRRDSVDLDDDDVIPEMEAAEEEDDQPAVSAAPVDAPDRQAGSRRNHRRDRGRDGQRRVPEAAVVAVPADEQEETAAPETAPAPTEPAAAPASEGRGRRRGRRGGGGRGRRGDESRGTSDHGLSAGSSNGDASHADGDDQAVAASNGADHEPEAMASPTNGGGSPWMRANAPRMLRVSDRSGVFQAWSSARSPSLVAPMDTVMVAEAPVVISGPVTGALPVPEPVVAQAAPMVSALIASAPFEPGVELQAAEGVEPKAAEDVQPQAAEHVEPQAAKDVEPEPVQGVVIRPIVIGADVAAPATRRVGWWRRN